jgi:hypothetical protein
MYMFLFIFNYKENVATFTIVLNFDNALEKEFNAACYANNIVFTIDINFVCVVFLYILFSTRMLIFLLHTSANDSWR